MHTPRGSSWFQHVMTFARHGPVTYCSAPLEPGRTSAASLVGLVAAVASALRHA